MPINLLYEQPLNNYIHDVVFNGAEPVLEFTNKVKGEFQSWEYVQQNRDSIVRAIIYQYFKNTLRRYCVDKVDAPYIVAVDQQRDDLPEWTTNVFDKGENIYEFDASKITNELRRDIFEIRDFVYSVADAYVKDRIDKALNSKQKPTIRFDFLKTHNNYDTFDKVLAASRKWHSDMAEKSTNIVKNRQFYEKSLIGTKSIMDLGDGVKIYQLLTPEALDFESENMGNCVGTGEYDTDVISGKTQIYSIRDKNGESHVTFEVVGGTIQQCKGKANKAPIAKYRPFIQRFVEAMRFGIEGDMANIGLIKQDGRYYDMFNLPKGLVVKGNLDFSGAGLTSLPDLSTVVVNGSFNCSDNQLTDLNGAPKEVNDSFICNNNHLTSLSGAPKKIGGNFNCSNNRLTNLNGAPKKIGGSFNCSDNQLTDLNGAPQKIAGSFNCSDNLLTDLNGAPKEVNDSFICNNNHLTSLNGAPQKVGNNFDCSHNQLPNLTGGPKEVNRGFFCSDNQLTDLNGAPQTVRFFYCSNNQLTEQSGVPNYVLQYLDKVRGINNDILHAWKNRLKKEEFNKGKSKLKIDKLFDFVNKKDNTDVR